MPTSTTEDQVWRQHAKCTPDTAELFWPAVGPGRLGLNSPGAKAALKLCRACPVIADCHAHELANPSRFAHIAAGRMWPLSDEGRRVLDGAR